MIRYTTNFPSSAAATENSEGSNHLGVSAIPANEGEFPSVVDEEGETGKRKSGGKFEGPAKRAVLTEAELANRWNIEIKTLQNWRLKGMGPPFTKLYGGIRYLLILISEYERANTWSSTTAMKQGLCYTFNPNINDQDDHACTCQNRNAGDDV